MTFAEDAELFLRLQELPCLICGSEEHLTEEGHRPRDERSTDDDR